MNYPVTLRAQKLNPTEQSLHFEAMMQATRYLESEAKLLDIIIEIDRQKLYSKFDLNSTFVYCLKYLNLSEAVAYNFIAVARKAREVPALKLAIDNGDLGVSKARKIVSVLTKENQKEWIAKATNLSQAKLEREVVEYAPQKSARDQDRVGPAKNGRIKLEANISEELMAKIRQAQNLVGNNASLEETLAAMTELFLEQKDPVRRAARAIAHPPVTNNSCDEFTGQRKAIPAATLHAVHRRDLRQCQAKRADGNLCGSNKYLQIHHIVPISEGGTNNLSNLLTLCGRCHRRWHATQ